MKTLKFQVIGMFLIAILLSMNTNTFAQKGYGKCDGTGKGNGNGQGNICNNIPDLTADQQAKIDKLKTAHMKEIQSLRNELSEKEAHLQTLRTADKADMVSINQTIDEISVIKTTMAKSREQHFQDVRGLLTDDQKVVFDSRGQGKGFGKGNCNYNETGQGRGNGCCGRNR